MTAKEYLKQAWNIDQRINDKLDQVVRLREMATKATTTMSDMPRSSSPNPQRMESVVTRLADMEADIDADIDQLVDLKIDIMRTIWQVEDVSCRLVLELRYHSFKSWEDIASELNYTVRWVHKLHGRALVAVDRILAKSSH